MLHNQSFLVCSLIAHLVSRREYGFHEQDGNTLADRQANRCLGLRLLTVGNLDIVIHSVADERFLSSRHIVEDRFAGVPRVLEERHGTGLKGNIGIVFEPRTKARVRPVGARVED